MRSLSEIACKRCNSNDGNSAFEAVVGELRATLLRRSGGVARVRIPHHARGRIRQNVDSFSHNRLSSPFFTQWVCTLVATPPQTTPAPPPIGGIALHGGSTRRRHAVRGLRVVQNPHRHRRGERRGHGEPGRSAHEQRQGAAIARLLARGLRQSTALFAQQQPHLAASVQNSPCTPALAACPVQNSPHTPALAACAVQNSPCSPEMAQFGAFSACRESFIPFSPPRSPAGRVLYRTRGRDRASQHNSTPGPTGMERKTPEEPQDPAAVRAAAGW